MDVGGAGGEGMVAIVQGTREAGLAVTLLNKTHVVDSIKNHQRLAVTRSSVETNTHCIKHDAPVQVCDDRYASSYQMAHCYLKPTSPEQHITEFPPQRTKPSRTTGNFEIRPSRKDNTYHVMAAQTCHKRKPVMPTQEGSFYSPRSSHFRTDEFVSSLRRYPFSPERSASTELVQRLLNYTHDKHLSRSNSHSLRSLNKTRPSITISSAKDKTVAKPAILNKKDTQTFTRTEMPTRDHGSHTNDDLRIGNRSKKTFKNHNLDSRYKSDPLNETYNYLKASCCSRRSYTGRGSEVRYLNDVKRCIKETLRQMVDKNHQVCPNIQQRYGRHMEKHHATYTEEDKVDKSDSKRIPCCICKKVDKGVYVTESKPRSSMKRLSPCPCKINKGDDKLDELIAEWLQELPISSNDTPQDKLKRQQMCEELAENLNNLKGSENFDYKAKEEIKKCIDSLPMWYPGAKRDQEMFKNLMADNLFNKMTAKKSTALKGVILQWLDNVALHPVDNKGRTIDNEEIGDDIVKRLNPIIHRSSDEIKEEVMDILQQLPIVTKNNETVQDAHHDIADKLVKDVKELQRSKDKTTSTDDSELADQIWECLENATKVPYEIKNSNHSFIKNIAQKLNEMRNANADNDSIKEEIENFLDALPKIGIAINPSDRNRLVKNLVNQVLPNKSRVDSELTQEILGPLESATRVPSDIKNINQSFVQNFARKVKEMQNANATNDELKKEIEKFLDALPKKGIPLNPSKRNQLVRNLIDEVQSEPYESRSEGEIAQKIWSHLENAIKMPSDVKNKNQVPPITNKSRADNEPAQNILDRLENATRVPSDVKKMNQNFNQNFTRKLSDPSKSRKRWDQNEDGEKIIENEISKIVDDIPTNIDDKTRNDIKARVSHHLAPHLRFLGNQDMTREMTDDVENILKKQAKMKDADASNTAVAVLKRVKGMSRSSVFFRSTSDVDELHNMVKEEVEDVLHGFYLPIDDDLEAIVGDITDVMTDQIVRGTDNDTTKDQISNILQNAKVSSGDVKLIKHRLMERQKDMSSWFKHQDSQNINKSAEGLQKFKTSTPRRENISFSTNIDSNISAVPVDGSSLKTQTTSSSPEEETFVNKLANIIKLWMDDINLNFNESNEKTFKETKCKDLARDMVDRQKYLQLNPNIKVSDKDELENLKYQVFRSLNKFIDDKALSNIMPKTKALLEEIKRIDVPQLRKGPTRMSRHSTIDYVHSEDNSLTPHEKTHYENPAGDHYKQELRRSIAQILPSEDLSEGEQANFELMKQNLADAFINMNYEGLDKLQKHKYKQKINHEIEKFCNNFLKNHPGTPIDTKKTNKELFKALNDVSKPDEESTRGEVERINLKDEVNGWIHELPLKEQTSVEKLQIHKMASMLATNLHALEKEKGTLPEKKYYDKVKKEIENFLSKLPLTTNNKEIINQHANDLLGYVKDTENLRGVISISKSDLTIDSESSSAPVDKGSQIEIAQPSPSSFTETTYPSCLQSSGAQTPCPGILKVCSPADVSPHVIVKEYYWDSVESSMKPICRGSCASYTAPPCFPPPPCQSPKSPCGPKLRQNLSQTRTPVPSQRSPYKPSTAPRACISSAIPCPARPNLSYDGPVRPGQASQVSPKSSVPQSGPCGTEFRIPCSLSPKRPCFMRRDIPQNSSEDAEATGRSCPRVTKLGSLDQMENVCKNPNFRKIRDYVWDDCEVCNKSRRCIPSDENIESFIKERKEENRICRCKERVFSKCNAKRRGQESCPPGQSCEESMKSCAKCCGMCPYPSYMFFKK